MGYPRGAVAATVCRGDGDERRYLLARRSKPPKAGSWSLPGGKLEWGEAIVVGAAREIEGVRPHRCFSPVAPRAIHCLGCHTLGRRDERFPLCYRAVLCLAQSGGGSRGCR